MAKILKNNAQSNDDYLKSFRPIEVVVPENGRLEESIRRFRTLVTRERIMSYLKEHQSFEKPSEKKRRKQRESFQRQRKFEMSQRFAQENGNERKRKNNNKQRQASTNGRNEEGTEGRS